MIKTKHVGQVYKALMVRENTHLLVAVQAKKRGMTIDEFIKLLYKKTVFLKK